MQLSFQSFYFFNLEYFIFNSNSCYYYPESMNVVHILIEVLMISRRNKKICIDPVFQIRFIKKKTFRPSIFSLLFES